MEAVAVLYVSCSSWDLYGIGPLNEPPWTYGDKPVRAYPVFADGTLGAVHIATYATVDPAAPYENIYGYQGNTPLTPAAPISPGTWEDGPQRAWFSTDWSPVEGRDVTTLYLSASDWASGTNGIALPDMAGDMACYSTYGNGTGTPFLVDPYILYRPVYGDNGSMPSEFWTNRVDSSEIAPLQSTLRKDTQRHIQTEISRTITKYSPGSPARWVRKSYESCKLVHVLESSGTQMVPTGRTITITRPVLDSSGTPTGATITQQVPEMVLSAYHTPDSWIWRCKTVEYDEYTPATPPGIISQQVIVDRPYANWLDYHVGWNAGGNSIGMLPSSGAVEFKARKTTGIVAGMAPVTEDVGDPGYVNIAHGFSLSGLHYKIIENGVERPTTYAFADGDTFRVERRGANIAYLLNGTVIDTGVGELGPVVLDASLFSGGDELYAPALVAIDGESATGSAEVGPALAGGGEGVYAFGTGLMRVQASGKAPQNFGRAEVLVDAIGSNRPYAFGSGRGPAPRAAGSGVPSVTPSYGLGYSVVFPADAIASGLTGEIGHPDYDYAYVNPPMAVGYDRVYGAGSSTLAPLMGFGAGAVTYPKAKNLPMPRVDTRGNRAVLVTPRAELHASGGSIVNGADLTAPRVELAADGGGRVSRALPTPQLTAGGQTTIIGHADLVAPVIELISTGSVGSVGGIGASLPAAAMDARGGGAAALHSPTASLYAAGVAGSVVRGTLTLPAASVTATGTMGVMARAILTLPMLARVHSGRVDAQPPPPSLIARSIGSESFAAEDFDAYVVNLRTEIDGGGNEMTRFPAFPFRHAVRHNGRTVLLGLDGLYVLGGVDDSGVPITWSIHTGTTDFGTSQLKHLSVGYLGGRVGPGTKFTVVEREQREAQYSYTTPRGQVAQNYRQVFGRGLRARYFSFGLEGEDEFELDDMTILAQPVGRKV